MAPANISWMNGKHYDSDLTNEEYAVLEPLLLPLPKGWMS